MSDQFNDRNRFRGRYEEDDFDYEGGYGRRNDFGRSYRGEYDYGRDYGYGRGGAYGRGTDFDRDYGRNYGWNRDYGAMTRGSEYNQGINRGSSFNRGEFDRDYGYNRGSSMRDYNRGQSFNRGRASFGRDYDYDYDIDFDFDEPVTSFTYYEIWMIPGPETGRGPQGYRRSDDRILEDVNDRLMQHGRVDASNVTVDVANGEVTLNGSVNSRLAKRMAEDAAESVLGVTDVHNNLKVQGKQPEQGRLTGQVQGQHSQGQPGQEGTLRRTSTPRQTGGKT